MNAKTAAKNTAITAVVYVVASSAITAYNTVKSNRIDAQLELAYLATLPATSRRITTSN